MKSDLRVGQTGDFEVTYRGASIFSKRKLMRFPDEGEVEARLAEVLAPTDPGKGP